MSSRICQDPHHPTHWTLNFQGPKEDHSNVEDALSGAAGINLTGRRSQLRDGPMVSLRQLRASSTKVLMQMPSKWKQKVAYHVVPDHSLATHNRDLQGDRGVEVEQGIRTIWIRKVHVDPVVLIGLVSIQIQRFTATVMTSCNSVYTALWDFVTRCNN